MARLRLEGITKRFGDNEVVSGVDLDIVDGGFVVLVGPSGCGKSTTLRMVAGLEEPNAGSIHIGDTDVTRLSPRDRDIAMVFQSYALYPHMTVYDNIAFGLRLRKVERSEIDRRVGDAAELLGITDLLARKPKQLSGGQRQRVAMGHAIVRQPSVFLFDEPLSNLDAKLRVAMRAEIAKLHRRLGVTTMYVTHDQVEAMTLAHQIVVMNLGVVQQVGAPLVLYNQPVNTFVATFVGSPSMNLFDATLSSAAGGVPVISGDGFELEVPPPWRTHLGGAGQELVLGVRPESLSEVSAGEADLLGEVDVLEPLGAEIHALGRVGDRTFTASLSPESTVRVGDRVPLAVDRGKLHLFARDTGVALGRTGPSVPKTQPAH